MRLPGEEFRSASLQDGVIFVTSGFFVMSQLIKFFLRLHAKSSDCSGSQVLSRLGFILMGIIRMSFRRGLPSDPCLQGGRKNRKHFNFIFVYWEHVLGRLVRDSYEGWVEIFD